MNLEKGWVIDRILTIKEREVLFLRVSSAGINVYENTRMNGNIKEFPYVAYNSEEMCVTGTRDIETHLHSRKAVTYEQVMDALEKKIKKIEIWT